MQHVTVGKCTVLTNWYLVYTIILKAHLVHSLVSLLLHSPDFSQFESRSCKVITAVPLTYIFTFTVHEWRFQNKCHKPDISSSLKRDKTFPVDYWVTEQVLAACANWTTSNPIRWAFPTQSTSVKPKGLSSPRDSRCKKRRMTKGHKTFPLFTEVSQINGQQLQ